MASFPGPGFVRILDTSSTSVASGGGTAAPTTSSAGEYSRPIGETTAPTTASLGVYVRPLDNRGAVKTVRASTDYNASVTSTQTSDVTTYGGALGMTVYLDQSAVAASSAGGGTGVLTHTIQFKDPIGATYTASTGVLTGTTGVGTWILQCYPGAGTVAPTSGAVGKADLMIPGTWRINTTSSSSATNFTYSISAIYTPTAASSS